MQLQVAMVWERSLETAKREKTLLLYAVTSFAELMTCAKACRLVLALTGGMIK
jgi:hypothetical protein